MTHDALFAPTRDRLRDSTGLVVTIGLHAGLLAIGLLAVTVSLPHPPAPPLITRPIPDTPKPPPLVAPPVTVDPVQGAQLSPPIWETDVPPQTLGPIDSPLTEPKVIGPPETIVPPRVVGPTVTAKLDKRADSQPPYPPSARRLGEEGAVVVHVRIGRDGRVLAASLAQSSGSPRLDAAAVAHALAHWRFSPALKDGEAIEATRDITVSFKLADAAA